MAQPLISVVPYDPARAVQFDEQRALLEVLLAPWLTDGVQHIGSTSIPGLAAKPIIDMLAGIADLHQARAAIPVLEDAGWIRGEHRPHEAHWLFRVTDRQSWQATHHLHLTEPTSALWHERLAFRDTLRARPDLLAEYQALKLSLAQERGRDDPVSYTNGKRAFVAKVLTLSGVELTVPPTGKGCHAS